MLVDRPNDFSFYSVEPLRQGGGHRLHQQPRLPVLRAAAAPAPQDAAGRRPTTASSTPSTPAIWDQHVADLHRRHRQGDLLLHPAARPADRARSGGEGGARSSASTVRPGWRTSSSIPTTSALRTPTEARVAHGRHRRLPRGRRHRRRRPDGRFRQRLLRPGRDASRQARRQQQPDPSRPSRAASRPTTASSPVAARCRSRPSSGSSPTRSAPRSWTRTRTAMPDLGQTWSVPTIGRIKVIESGKRGRQVRRHLRRRHGRRQQDRARSAATGSTWWTSRPARRSTSASSSAPRRRTSPRSTSDLDGYLDTIYIGTTSGFLYKVDISSPGTLQDVTLQHHPGGAAARRRHDGEADHRHVVGSVRDLRHGRAGRSTSRRRSSTSPG